MGTTPTHQEEQDVRIPVSGMTCDACENKVTRALSRLKGVDRVDVSVPRGEAHLYGKNLPSRDTIDGAIRKAGYEPSAPSWLSTDKTVWKAVGISGAAVALVAIILSLSGLTDVLTTLADPTKGGLLVALTLGLTAGVSTCMAMVGGLVLGFSATHAAHLAEQGEETPKFLSRIRPQLWFNLGRIVGFGLLGALLGAVGSTLTLPVRLTAVLILAVGAVMILLGVRLSGISPRMAGWTVKLPGSIGKKLGLENEKSAYSSSRTALVGALTFFLPCGFTQAVQIYALASASALTAGLVMAIFAVGTTPGLLALGSVPEIATGKTQTTVLRVVGVVVLAFAVLNISGAVKLLDLGGGTGGENTVASQPLSSNVSVAGGKQTVRMTQKADGYSPENTVVYAGVPIVWEIDGTYPYSCSSALTVPSEGIQTNLRQGPNTVNVPALAEGTTTFTCTMGMYSGTFTAVKPPATPAAEQTGARWQLTPS